MPISEEEFRQRTVSKYREHFDHVYDLLEFAQEAIGNYKAFTRTVLIFLSHEYAQRSVHQAVDAAAV
jgi:hypothetical protein